jgi:NTE family protein
MSKKKALVLGGGAPNFTLMSGALLALHHAKLEFEIFYMAGGGAVVGLIYLAPRVLTPEQALCNTMNFGVSDLIYSMMPINYKIFNKGGPSAERFREYWQSLPYVRAAMNQYWMSPAEKLDADWLLFRGAMMSPTDVEFFSTGICANVPFIENVVDFEKLKTVREACYINAYCIEDKGPVEFEKKDIDVRHFRAALSFPFVYPPYRIENKHYYEGAAFDCLNLIKFFSKKSMAGDIEQVVVCDVMTRDLIHRPRSLMDAYAQSIAVPLVANAEKELDLFDHWVNTGFIGRRQREMEISPELKKLYDKQTRPAIDPLYFIKLRIPEKQRPYALDWSRSNLEILFDVGYQAGKAFVKDPVNVSLFEP